MEHKEHDIVTYDGKKVTIIHLYKAYPMAVIEYSNNETEEVPLSELKEIKSK